MKTGRIKYILALLFILSNFAGAFAQGIGIGQWRLHLPYKSCIAVTGNSNDVFGATESGLFILHQNDNSIELLNKVNGLSDINVKTISWNSGTGSLFVGYKNANIDIVKGKTIVNIPDIKRAQIVGNKTINGVHFINNLAYLACGFGIVVVDMNRLEVKETYYIGQNGAYIEVNDIISDANNIYAGTENGVYWAPLNSPNLANFSSWSVYTGAPAGVYNHLAIFKNKLFANRFDISNGLNDQLYVMNLTSLAWTPFPVITNYEVKDLTINDNGNYLYMAEKYGLFLFDSTLLNPQIGYTYFPPSGPGPNPNDIFFDLTNYAIWVADENYGLVKVPYLNIGTPYSPDGPRTASVFDMSMNNGHLVVAPGGKNDAWGNIYNIDGVFSFKEGDWKTYNYSVNPGFDTLWDILSCAQVPGADDHIFLGSWGRGVIEISNGNIANVFNSTNSTLRVNPASNHTDCAGIAFDEDKNLWITNSFVTTCLNVRKPDNTWQAYDFTGTISSGTTIGNLLVTKNGQKWMILPRGNGMLVFDENGTLSNTTDDKKKKLGFTTGAGNISGGDVFCMAEDKDGEIWVGTDEGICVFYSPDNVFNSSNFDAQQILIEQDGYVQILLETQVVTAIAIDGANRKWIGTESGGVFLMSEDGTKQVLQFNVDNSPLLSNTITSIVIDEITGEVFFGTDKGIISYRSDATEGGETNGEIYAFPNPVTPEYDGPIAIKGLVKDADVKIADVRGNVVYQTKALGGQAIWTGKNFKGERAATGIYLVFITNEDGTETAITKILFVN